MFMTHMSARAAEILLDIGAVNFRPDTPYTLTSGALSPVYIDCRKIISFLPERREIITFAAEQLCAACDMTAVDYIAGGETAGIPYAAWISEALDKPMLYIRKQPKGFGKGSQIEGHMPQGSRVLLVEDLATDGGSKVAFANTIRAAGGEITDVFSIFFYGIYPAAEKIFSDAGLKLHALTTWRDVLAAARARKSFDDRTLVEVEKFLAAPGEWADRRLKSAM
jgi:orotate phosphoribosyltransferase